MSSKILRAFRALDAAGKLLVDYQIKFIEPRHFEETISQMKQFFLPYEKMSRSRKLADNPEAVEDPIRIWQKMLEDEKVSIGCFQNEAMVGANLLNIKRKSDEDLKIEVNSIPKKIST